MRSKSANDLAIEEVRRLLEAAVLDAKSVEDLFAQRAIENLIKAVTRLSGVVITALHQ